MAGAADGNGLIWRKDCDINYGCLTQYKGLSDESDAPGGDNDSDGGSKGGSSSEGESESGGESEGKGEH